MSLPNFLACEKYTLFQQVGTILLHTPLEDWILPFTIATLETSDLLHIILWFSNIKHLSRPFSEALLYRGLLAEVWTLISQLC